VATSPGRILEFHYNSGIAAVTRMQQIRGRNISYANVTTRQVDNVAVNFGDNSVLVDGELNFAESSNVIVKILQS
jgi:hypothetical protein